MKTSDGWSSGLAGDIRTSIQICTRLPLPSSALPVNLDLPGASWAFPVAGSIVGGAGALAFWGASALRLPPMLAAALALVVTLLATGCLHEDGLADTADGFGGGWDRARKLEIMHDSHLGVYGVCALVMSLLLRWSALAAFASPASAAVGLMAAHIMARATLPAFMHFVPPARADGLSAEAGQPGVRSAAAAGLLGALALTFTLGFPAMFIGLVLATSAGLLMAWLCMKQIGGQTGDVLGALEQVIEILILLTAVATSGLRP